MDNKIKELLSSAQADVQRKEQIRKKTEINKINSFYERAQENSKKFNKWLYKRIIDRYLTRNDNYLGRLARGLRAPFTDIEDYILDITVLTPITKLPYRKFNSSLELEERDEEAIKLIANSDTYPEDNIYIWTDGDKKTPILFNHEEWKKDGVTIKTFGKEYGLIITRIEIGFELIEDYIKKILDSKVLGPKHSAAYQNEIQELNKKLCIMQSYREKSINNANIIALEACKQFLQNYKSLPANRKDYRTIKHNTLYTSNLCIIENIDRDKTIPFINICKEYCKPDMLAIPYTNSNNETILLPMLKEDLIDVLMEINAYFQINNNGTLTMYIREDKLEDNIMNALNEDEDENEDIYSK